MAIKDLKEEKQNEDEHYTENDPLKETTKIYEKEDRTLYEKCIYAFKNLTFEPTMILFVISSVLMMTTSQNLSLEKACRVNLNFTDEICKALRNQDVSSENKYEKETQLLLTSAMRWRTYITATVPSIAAIFIGVWADATGHRKMFVLMPICGQILICISDIINSIYFYELNLEYLVFAEAIFEGLSGGWCIIIMTTFSYISVITTDETRTFRLGLVNFCMTAGFPIGMSVSGILLSNFGYIGCYSIAGCLNFVNLLYSTFWVKDAKRTAQQKKVFCIFF